MMINGLKEYTVATKKQKPTTENTASIVATTKFHIPLDIPVAQYVDDINRMSFEDINANIPFFKKVCALMGLSSDAMCMDFRNEFVHRIIDSFDSERHVVIDEGVVESVLFLTNNVHDVAAWLLLCLTEKMDFLNTVVLLMVGFDRFKGNPVFEKLRVMKLEHGIYDDALEYFVNCFISNWGGYLTNAQVASVYNVTGAKVTFDNSAVYNRFNCDDIALFNNVQNIIEICKGHGDFSHNLVNSAFGPKQFALLILAGFSKHVRVLTGEPLEQALDYLEHEYKNGNLNDNDAAKFGYICNETGRTCDLFTNGKPSVFAMLCCTENATTSILEDETLSLEDHALAAYYCSLYQIRPLRHLDYYNRLVKEGIDSRIVQVMLVYFESYIEGLHERSFCEKAHVFNLLRKHRS